MSCATSDAHAQSVPAGGQQRQATTPPEPAEKNPTGQSQSGTPDAPKAKNEAKPKSLDDLLGVPAASKDEESSSDAAEREQRRRLERSLDEASLDDLVAKTLESMKGAAARLVDQKDPGLGTQRLQEEALKSLDRLMEEAQRQQQQQQSSSSSRSRSRQQQNQNEDPSERQNGQSQPQSSRGQRSASSGDSANVEPPPPEDGSVTGSELSESRVEWGRLPDRIREMVLQGRRDRVSTIYERLTREYYRRLAEEASK